MSGINATYQKILIDDCVIKITDLSIFVSSKENKKNGILIDNSDLKITKNYRYGLVGPNGTGKSCLFNRLLSKEIPISDKIQIGYLNQNIQYSEKNIITEILESNEIWKMEQDLIKEEDPIKLDNFYVENPEILDLDSNVKKMLIALGFKINDFSKNCCDFSGGWVMRLSLIKALVMNPELLLLDEPTNHLDLDGVIWLENYLSNWKKTLVIVSHNRHFLDSICHRIISIDDFSFRNYSGNFSFYLDSKNLERRKLEKEYLEKSKKIKSKKERKKLRPSNYKVEFKLENEHLNNDKNISSLIKIEDVTFGYDEKTNILEKINLGIFNGDRLGIVGPNGAGKTTFIKLLTSELLPKFGKITIGNKIRVGRYVQHFEEILPLDKTPVEYLMSEYDINMEESRKYLGKFGLVSNAHTNIMRKCSGGQKARIVLASLSIKKLDVILMDEPTNHLDIETVDALILLLREFRGGIIIISHDMYLLDEINCNLYLCEDKKLSKFHGNIEDYKKLVLEKIADKTNMISKKKINADNKDIIRLDTITNEIKSNEDSISLNKIFTKRNKKRKKKKKIVL